MEEREMEAFKKQLRATTVVVLLVVGGAYLLNCFSVLEFDAVELSVSTALLVFCAAVLIGSYRFKVFFVRGRDIYKEKQPVAFRCLSLTFHIGFVVFALRLMGFVANGS